MQFWFHSSENIANNKILTGREEKRNKLLQNPSAYQRIIRTFFPQKTEIEQWGTKITALTYNDISYNNESWYKFMKIQKR